MLIGLLGNAGSGKDTVGTLLVKEHGFYAMAFADAIKILCSWLFNWGDAQLWGKSEQRDPVVRKALQTLGTEWARAIQPDCHVHFMQQRITTILQHKTYPADPLWTVLPTPVRLERLCVQPQCACCVNGSGPNDKINIVVTDCRFKNEIKGLQQLGGRVYRIVRNTPSIAAAAAAPDTQWRQHRSETEQKEIADSELDGIIENNETLENLSVKIKGILWEPACRKTTPPSPQ